jgi:hypothetical protein
MKVLNTMSLIINEADMFIWTAKEIQKNPLIVLSKQVKPSPERVKIQYLKNIGDLV